MNKVTKSHVTHVGKDFHPKMVLNFHCNMCKKYFTSKGVLKKHVENTHEKLKSHMCEFCSKRFSTKDGLQKHVKQLHLNPNKI